MQEEEPYKNREIREMFGDVKDRLDTILVQTTRHNGRMTKIEEWKERVMGATGVFLLIVIPLLVWGLKNIIDIRNNIQIEVRNAVKESLSVYEAPTR